MAGGAQLLSRLSWRKLFGRPADSQALPDGLAAQMSRRAFAAVQAEVQTLLRERRDAFAALLETARQLDWPPLEREKLIAYGHFYRGELASAFSRAAAWCGGTVEAGSGAPFDADLFMLAAISLFHNAQYEDAWRLMTRLGERSSALAGRGDYWSIRSSIAYATGRIREAWEASEEARRLVPDDALVAQNAYALAFRLPDMAAFERLRAEIAAGRFAGKPNAFALATPILAMDDYAAGFRIWEGRYAQEDAERYVNPALPTEKRFAARAADWPVGRTLLVSCEQGFGDTIQMARYFPLLTGLTGGRTIVETQPELLPLMAHNFPALRFLPREHGKAPAVAFDFWLGSMSLPYLFGTTADDVPARPGYLVVPEEARHYWRERVAQMAAGRPRVGLAWSGSPSHRTDMQRSIPFATIAARLHDQVDMAFFALQKAVPAARPDNLFDVSEELLTFADTAGLVAEMDLVVAVDTSVVHLAGALGKPTWLLLPYRYEWRWSLEGEGNRWYDSVRVLRQRAHGDWDPVLDEAFGARLIRQLAQRSC